MLTTLRRIVLEFTQEPELQTALSNMVNQIKIALDTDCCSVYIADYQQQNFLLMASDGLAQDSWGYTRIGFSEGLVGLVAQREEPINIADAKQHAHFKHIPEVKEDEFNAFLGTPIIHQRKVLGIITIQQRNVRSFDETEEAFLITLSARLSTALASAEARDLLEQTQSNEKWPKQFSGIAGASGIAMNTIYVSKPKADLGSITLQRIENHEQQIERYDQAVQKTLIDFEQMSTKLEQLIFDDSLDIFEMYKQLLNTANLGADIKAKITTGWNAESGLKLVIESYVSQFEALEDSYLRERASDIRDLGNRILYNLQQQQQGEINQSLPEQFILAAKEVSASMLAEYQHKGLKGIVSLTGSNNSHCAILARALGLPAVMGVDSLPLNQLKQQLVILDGYSGDLFIDPSDELKKEYQYLIAEEQELSRKVLEVVDLPAVTQDGQYIELLLNAGLSSSFDYSQLAGAIGVGLYRTEIAFMDRSCFPSEQEQTAWYTKVLGAFSGHTVTMRTLDVGGDKSLPYFPIQEDNPFLGWRGIRITLDHPEIFLLQIRAMLQANREHQNLEIMLPMISCLSEVDDAVRLINQAHSELSAELSCKLPRPKIGIMLEVPAVIFQLAEFAQRVDFFSVGSNDLTQYLLAVDRNNTQIANLYDAYHPAVLRALMQIAEQSAKLTISLSLCGELASEPSGAILLLAMGYDKLSMNPHSVARIKWVIRHIDYQHSREMLLFTLKLQTAKQVHDYLNQQLEELGFGGFVRAGK
jgi:phosphotransferase system enzyme I (PtsP)